MKKFNNRTITKRNIINNFLRYYNKVQSLPAQWTLPSRRSKLARIYRTGRGDLGTTRNKNNPKIEIDANVGGHKQNTTKLVNVPVTIQVYSYLYYVPLDGDPTRGTYKIGIGDPTNVASMIDGSTEMQYWKTKALQVKFKQVGVTVNYDRQPQAGERFPPLLTVFGSEKVDATLMGQLTLDPTVMRWDMTQLGNKLYNMNFNNSNTLKEHLGFQPISNYTIPTCYIRTSEYGYINLPDNETTTAFAIGQAMFWMRVIFKVPDYRTTTNRDQDDEKMQILAHDDSYKIYTKEYQDRIKYEKEMQDAINRTIEQQINIDQQYKENRTKEKDEIKELIQQGKTKEEATNLVRHWDRLTIPDEE